MSGKDILLHLDFVQKKSIAPKISSSLGTVYLATIIRETNIKNTNNLSSFYLKFGISKRSKVYSYDFCKHLYNPPFIPPMIITDGVS